MGAWPEGLRGDGVAFVSPSFSWSLFFMNRDNQKLTNWETVDLGVPWSGVAQNYGESFLSAFAQELTLPWYPKAGKWHGSALGIAIHGGQLQKQCSSKWFHGQETCTPWSQRQRRVERVSCGGKIWQLDLWAQVRYPFGISTSNLWTLQGRAWNLLSQGYRLWANFWVILLLPKLYYLLCAIRYNI